MDKIFLLLLVVCIWSSCFNAVNSKITSFNCPTGLQCPTFKLVSLGSNVTLNCSLVGAGHKVIFSRRNPIRSSKNKYILSGNILTITNFSKGDDGHYNCKDKNGSGHIPNSQRWVLMINYYIFKTRPILPSPRPDLFTTESLIGLSKSFDCWPKKKENYLMYSKIQDTHKARKFSDASRLRHNGGTYQIGKLGFNDSGYYYCGNQTSQGMKIWKKLGELVVRAWPRIIYSKGNPLQEGEMARFVCTFSGSSDPSWYKDGKKITQGGRIKLVNKKKRAGKKWLKLTIDNVSNADAGRYKCGVTIGGKTRGRSKNLSVFAFQHAAVVPQGLLAPNSSVNVTCETTETGIIRTRVYFRSYNSTESFKRIKPDNKKYFKVAFNVISIVDLNKQDEGEYKCQAKWFGMHIKKKAGEVRLI